MYLKYTSNKETTVYNLDKAFFMRSDGMGHLAINLGWGSFDTIPMANVEAFLEAFEMAVKQGVTFFEWSDEYSK